MFRDGIEMGNETVRNLSNKRKTSNTIKVRLYETSNYRYDSSNQAMQIRCVSRSEHKLDVLFLTLTISSLLLAFRTDQQAVANALYKQRETQKDKTEIKKCKDTEIIDLIKTLGKTSRKTSQKSKCIEFTNTLIASQFQQITPFLSRTSV